METKSYKEEAIFCYGTEYGDALEIFASDLKNAEIGKEWTIEDVDRFPNAKEHYQVSYKVVFKDGNGVAVLFRSEYSKDPRVELRWVELH